MDKFKVALVVVLSIALIAGWTDSALAERDHQKIYAEADSFVRGGAFSGDNYGAQQKMDLKTSESAAFTRIAYIKINLESYLQSSVDSAVFYIHNRNAITSTPVHIYGLTDDDWTESGLTWDNQPSAEGAVHAATVDIEDTGWYEADITSYVNSQLTDKVITLKIESSDLTSIVFDTKENDNRYEVRAPYVLLTAGNQTINISEDAFIRGGSYSNINYGTSGAIVVKGSSSDSFIRKSFMKADLSAYTHKSTEAASLHFYNQNDIELTPITVHGYVDDTWTETGVTWDNPPHSAGSTVIGAVYVSSPGWYSLDVTDYINRELDDQHVTFMLENTNLSTEYVNIAAREGAQGRGAFIQIVPTQMENDYSVVQDSYITGGVYGYDNYSSQNKLIVHGSLDEDEVREAYLQVDYTALGSVAGHSVLRFYVNHDVSATPVVVYGLVDHNWAEETLTWNNKPDESSIAAIGTVTVTNKGWYTIDVTGYVASQAAGSKRATFKLANESQVGERVEISASEGSHPPVLYIHDGNTPDEFDLIRESWRAALLGGVYDDQDIDVLNFFSQLDHTVQNNWAAMNKSTERTSLWSDISNYTPTNIHSAFQRLEAMSIAYSSRASVYEGNTSLLNDIIDGMDWLYDHWYNETTSEFDSWWHWETGIPLTIHSIVIILYEDFTEQQRLNYMSAIYHFQPDPYIQRYTAQYGKPNISTGYNRINSARTAILRGIITKEPLQLTDGRHAISDVLRYVSSGDGFYTDGSFIQHTHVPYNFGYGLTLLGGLIDLLDILHGFRWEVQDPKVDHVYEWVEQSYKPFMFKAQTMDMVRGRNISRYNSTARGKGHEFIDTLARLAEIAPSHKATAYKSLIKYWLNADNEYDHLASPGRVQNISMIKAIMQDETVVPSAAPIGHYIFPSMDRVVHHRSGFAFGISMSSSRISNYESMNGENLRGWHTGSGATYLYNDDLQQYNDAFWPTVNPYRLPGTTVDTAVRADGDGRKFLPEKDWVGGASLDGLYGVTGMDFLNYDSTLEARKSWFMFDDEIVALGAQITSNDSRTIETIMDNRMMNSAGDNMLTVDGVVQSDVLGWSGTLAAVNWVHLEGNEDGADIGYYLPLSSDMEALREERTGAWSDIRVDGPNDPISRNYLTLWFDHGINPTNASYAYVLLPGKSAVQVENYATAPDIAILANSGSVQAVKETNLNIVAANFWTDQVETVDVVTVNKKAAVLVRETEHWIEVSLSDPTMNNSGQIEVELDLAAASVLSKDDEITVTQLGPTIEFSVNVDGARGRSFSIRFLK